MDATVRRFVEAVASWESDLTNARPIIDRATECLVAGHGGDAIGMLAGTPAARADDEVWELLPAALVDLGVDWTLGDTERNAILTAAAAARRYLDGEITARGLCSLIHQRHGHATHALVEALSAIDDSYDNVELLGWNEERFGPEVDVAVAALIAGEERLLRGADPDTL